MPTRRRCWWREILCFLFWIVIASAVPATIILTIQHRTQELIYLGYSGDTIELMSVDGFWYDDLTVSQVVVETEDRENRVQLYLPRCSDIEVYQKSGHYVSPYHCHSYPSRHIGTVEYTYLVSGSTVTYSICMKSNETQNVPQAQFFIFNNLLKYQDYVYGSSSGKKTSVFQQRMNIGTFLESAVCSKFTFTAKKSSYYFMTGWLPAGITYQYNITSHTKYLHFKDYRENKSCSALTGDHECEIPVGSQFLSKSEKYCLLAHIIPHSGNRHWRASPTTHVRVSSRKREEVVVIPILVILVGVVGLLVVVVTYCCCCCKKCCHGHRPRGRGYTLINV